ncbi:WD40 repeat-like protein [Gloeopeniophorella convolvens]|nr:WD40 repeat-like protein [Gloeopeniophorella convolvens]
MSLSSSSTLAEYSTPTTSSKLPADAYVLAIASCGVQYAASASAPSNKIHLFDRTSLRLTRSLDGHRGGTTSLRAVDALIGVTQRMLVSSGKDGIVRVWDDRTGAAAIEMPFEGRQRGLLSCDVSPDGLTVAAGSELQGEDALIVYWDPRHPAAPLRKHTSTHSDDITAVHFARTSAGPPLLLSGSTDGLVSISNADEQDEDEAVLHVGNLGSSIAQAGWLPPRAGGGVWAASDMETFSVWSDELDPHSDLDIRAPSVHTQARTWVTDYLIGCHASDASGLSVFVGSNEGDVALLRPQMRTRAVALDLERLWTGQHRGVVRSTFWDERNHVLLTGGEDAQLFAWPCAALPGSGMAADGASEGSASFPSVLAKRDHDGDGDVEMRELSPRNKKARRAAS